MLRNYFSDALHIDPATKPRLYIQIYKSAEIASASYIMDLIFSAGIATLGLVLNSPAVVIGAMLISPLMGPILASGLAFAASDIYLRIKSFLSLVGSIVASVAFSAALVWVLPFQTPTTELLARTQPNLLDLGVAVFAGLAGSGVMARSLSGGGASALPGVAIAVALMPPLCTVGFGIGSGWNWQIISGAGLLFLTNFVAIASCAFLIFYLVGMDAPAVRGAISESEIRQVTGTGIYSLLHDSVFRKLFGGVGQLRWRIVMIVVTLALLFVPLRSSLLQLQDETRCRAAAREATTSLVPADHLLSQQLEILPDRLIQRLVTTTPVEKPRVLAAEATLSRKTGKVVSIEVRQVANEEELITLRERLRSPAPSPAVVRPSLQTLATTVRPLVEGPLKSVWPTEAAELKRFEIGFSGDAIVLHLGYNAPKAFDGATEEAIRNALRQSLGSSTLTTTFEWQPPLKVVPAPRKNK